MLLILTADFLLQSTSTTPPHGNLANFDDQPDMFTFNQRILTNPFVCYMESP